MNRSTLIHSFDTVFKKTLRSAAVLSIAVIASVPATALAQHTVAAFATTQSGSWSAGTATGAPDESCANIGSVDAINAVAGFGLDSILPLNASAITVMVNMYATTTPTGDDQLLSVQAHLDAVVPVSGPIGTGPIDFNIVGLGAPCKLSIGADDWMTPAVPWTGAPATLTRGQVATAEFGIVTITEVSSSVKVNSICLEVTYTGDAPAPGTFISCEDSTVSTTSTTTSTTTTTTTTAAPTTTTTTTTLPPPPPEVPVDTMNRYGLALLALLMLGIGFIGFRRFS